MHLWVLALALLPVQEDAPSITCLEPLNRAGEVWTASGDCVVTWQDVQLETDALEYNNLTRMLSAEGQVTFTRGEERLTGSRMEIRTDTRAGVIYDANGWLKPDLRVESSEIIRREDGIYEVVDGILVFCDETGEPVWEVTASRTPVDPDTYLSSWNNVLRVGGFPVFYLPYLRTSLEPQQRSSGFLMPQLATSTTKGRSVQLPVYWAINRSSDLTVYGEYFSKRGMGGGAEFRWVPSANSRIDVNNSFVDDRLGAGGQRTQIFAGADWERLRTYADLDIFSSYEYRQVFDEDFNVISSPIEQSRAFATYNTPKGISYNVDYYRQGTFFGNQQQTTIVRRMPELEVLLHTRPLGNTGAYFSLEGSVAGLHRRDAAINSPALVGRLDVNPRIDLPLVRGPAISWTHSVGIRETFYTHRSTAAAGDLLNRLVFDYGFRLSGPRFERSFGSWSHRIQPEIAYRYVNGVDDFTDTLRVDDVDLVVDTNEVRYGIINSFVTDREVLRWSLTQKYFLDPSFGSALVPGIDNVFNPLLDLTGFDFADQPRRFSPIVSLLRFAPDSRRAADLQIDYDPVIGNVRSAGLIGRYSEALTSLNVAYFLTYPTPIQIRSNQVRASIGYGGTERRGLNGSLSFSYNIDESILQATVARLSYNTDCYGLHFEFSQFDVGSRKENRFGFAFSLSNLGSIGTLRRPDQIF